MTSVRPFVLRPRAVALLGLLLPILCPAYEWSGSAGSYFTSTASWNGEAPVAGALNKGDLLVVNGPAAPLVYSEKQGATRFESLDFKIGTARRPGGSMLMTGGELTVVSRWAPMVGHNNNRTSTLTLTGGKLTFGSHADARPEERSFRVGNWKGRGTRGILNLTGGILVLDTPGDIALGGLVIACNDASAEVTLNGGLLVVSSVFGTSFQPTGGRGVGVLTFGPGDGVFMQTDSKQILFGPAGGELSFINFVNGSRGQLSLASATRADFEAWVKAGKIRLDGRPTTPDRFRWLSLDGQGTYMLAPSP